jgi:hypothetical protein
MVARYAIEFAPGYLTLNFTRCFGNEFWCANISILQPVMAALATIYGDCSSNIPGIDAMLQKFLKIDVLVDFVSNNIYVLLFLQNFG